MSNLEELTNFAVQWCKLNFEEELTATIRFNRTLLCRRINGRFIPNENVIEISPQLYELNPIAAQAVVKHEMTHWLMWTKGKPAYDNLTPFETMLKNFGLITNGNYPRTKKVVLAHQKVKVISCETCRDKLFDVMEIDDYKIPQEMNLQCSCEKYPKMVVGREMVVHYTTYEYLSYNTEKYLYQLSGDFMLQEDYTLAELNPNEGYVSSNRLRFL